MSGLFGKIAAATGLLDRLRASWKQDLRAGISPLRDDLARLTDRIESLQSQIAALQEGVAHGERAERLARQIRLTMRLNEKHADLLAELPSLLAAPAIVAHVRQAILNAPLNTDPYPHIVVEELLPPSFYRMLLKAIPPAEFFGDRDPIKQNLRIPFDDGPALTERVWAFMDAVVAREGIRPAVMERFREPLRERWDTLLGVEFRERAAALPQAISGGRVMLRRPGYYLAPHRDPKRAMVTCLMYLASRHTHDTYGTEIYRVHNDRESPVTRTYYPEQDGARCELVKVVPNRPNSILIFLNSHGAHGARIPADAPAETERYAYQFYIGPEQAALDVLIDELPPDRAAMWRSKDS